MPLNESGTSYSLLYNWVTDADAVPDVPFSPERFHAQDADIATAIAALAGSRPTLTSVNALIAAAKTELLGGVGSTFDTLAELAAHATSTSNPHSVTKAQVGLGSVPNVDATARANHTGTQSASTVTHTASGTGGVSRTLADRASEVVSLRDYGGVGDYNVTTGAGTSNNTALTNALAINGEVYVPAGNYLFSTYAVLQQVLNGTIWGPGKLYYNNGSMTEIIGSQVRAGVSDADGNLGENTQGGVIFGGEGPGVDGTLVYGAHPQWLNTQPTRRGASAEFQIYSTALFAMARGVVGTAFLDAEGGYTFNYPEIEVGDVFGFGEKVYRIKTKVSATRIEVELPYGAGAVTFASNALDTFRHAFVWGEGTCDVNGTAVTRKTGDYFFWVAPYEYQAKIRIGATWHQLEDNGYAGLPNNLTLTASAGTQTGVTFLQKMLPLSLELSMFRLQGLIGGDEEGYGFFHTIDGRNTIESQYAGNGRYRSISVRTGPEYDLAGGREALQVSADGRIGMGGYDYVGSAWPTDAKVHVWRDRKVAQSANGTTDSKSLDLWGTFNGSGPRHLTLGIYNNFNAGYIQGWVVPDTTPGAIALNPQGGNVGIGTGGTSTLSATLHVVGSILGTNGLLANSASGIRVANTNTQQMQWDGGAGNRWRAISTINGASAGDLVFQGTNDSFVANFVNAIVMKPTGAVQFTNVGTTAAGANAVIDNGASNTLLRSTSASKYKTDVEPMSTDVLTKFLALQPIYYRSKASADRQDWTWYGFLAEDVAAIDPRFVAWSHKEADYDEIRTPAEPEYEDRAVRDEDGNPVIEDGAIKIERVQTNAGAVHISRQLKPGTKMTPDGVSYDRLGAVVGLGLAQRHNERLNAIEAFVEQQEAGGRRKRVRFEGREYNVSLERVALAISLAGAAISHGIQAGETRWHGGPDPFTLSAADGEAVPMDAPTVIKFGFAALKASEV